jgi:hypothetical protein
VGHSAKYPLTLSPPSRQLFFAECCRGTRQSARQKTLGKKVFADEFFAVYSLPSAALGKAFAECIYGFAEYPGHSAKRLIPVVMTRKKNGGSGRMD